MRHRKLWLSLFIIFFTITSISLYLFTYLNRSINLLEDTNIQTGLQNSVLAIDKEREIFFVGTYNNKLMAFSNKTGEELWEMEAKGPFKKLVVHSDEGVIYAGNEDNHVYVVDIGNGDVIQDIDVERRIFDIAVTKDGNRIVISAGVNTAKHNVLVYSGSGKQLFNHQFRTQIKGICLTADESSLIIGNNRAELVLMDYEANELKKFSARYEIIAIKEFANHHIAMCSDGSYYVFDDELNILRYGIPKMLKGSTANAVGSDSSGDNVFIGTKEGNIYVLNSKNEQIYNEYIGNTVSHFLALDSKVYLTGYGDFVKVIDVGALESIVWLQSLYTLIHAFVFVIPILALISLAMFIPATNRFIKKIGRTVFKYRVAYILLIPTFALLIFFNYTPILMAFTRAFTNWSKFNYTAAQIKFIGLDNFKTMFTEGYFLTGLSNLALLLVTGFAKALTVPLFIAWLVYSMKGDRKKYSFRFLFVLPIIVPSVVSALLWLQIYDPTIGMLNQLLDKLGLESLQRVWLGNEQTAIWAIIFMGFPFINALAFLVYYGGLTGIDHCLYEAARIDGAKRKKIFWKIQLPMIMPQIKLMLVLTFIGIVQDFNGIYLLTGGGPGTSTYVPGLELYYNATTFGRYGYACALGIVMFIFIMGGTLINIRIKADNS